MRNITAQERKSIFDRPHKIFNTIDNIQTLDPHAKEKRNNNNKNIKIYPKSSPYIDKYLLALLDLF
jgi:hypothetical protein